LLKPAKAVSPRVDLAAKLRAYGIAPPRRAEQGGLINLTRARTPVACPWCGSKDPEPAARVREHSLQGDPCVPELQAAVRRFQGDLGVPAEMKAEG